ncbi:MAG: hypothetical protein M1416_02270 [Candidatus Pacearchaeota archaeon]|nr:hypothetical protein [Candidatus Pacearchaeota archaeon]
MTNFKVADYRFGTEGKEPSFMIYHNPFYKSLKTEKDKLRECSISLLEAIAHLNTEKNSENFNKIIYAIKNPPKKPFSLDRFYYLIESNMAVIGTNNQEKIINRSLFSKIKLGSDFVLDLTFKKKNIFLVRQIEFGGDKLFEELYESFGGKW